MMMRLLSMFKRQVLDIPLLLGVLALMGTSIVVLYSATNENAEMVFSQVIRTVVALIVMFAMASIPPKLYARWAFAGYILCTLLLVAVLVAGHVGKGAERWLDLGIIRFQPSEFMKIIMPMTIAAFFARRVLPARLLPCIAAIMLILLPVGLIVMQPDLGTAVLITVSGSFIVYLAGLNWYLILSLTGLAVLYAPIHWFFFMYDYQKHRIITFLNPESDPLNKGYNIIQSKIAIGSGGPLGKGWLQGTQSHLQFLPESHTDFIFAVYCEEFGFAGFLFLMALYAAVIARCAYISLNAQNTFERLLSGALTLTFFFYIFVNVGMVSGLLPVVGVPLPMISYGGTSMITLSAAFGIIMAIRTHHKKQSF
ncbi:MAG: rod shape-determining protein RodA [Succinivibrionaceae bacterium]|nr:rod shape-determining protein RodA [Succinivibrionaceae bacterium]